MKRYGAKPMTQRANRTAAMMLVTGCTDAALARLDIATLVGSYGVTPEYADALLRNERDRRAGQ